MHFLFFVFRDKHFKNAHIFNFNLKSIKLSAIYIFLLHILSMKNKYVVRQDTDLGTKFKIY